MLCGCILFESNRCNLRKSIGLETIRFEWPLICNAWVVCIRDAQHVASHKLQQTFSSSNQTWAKMVMRRFGKWPNTMTAFGQINIKISSDTIVDCFRMSLRLDKSKDMMDLINGTSIIVKGVLDVRCVDKSKQTKGEGDRDDKARRGKSRGGRTERENIGR